MKEQFRLYQVISTKNTGYYSGYDGKFHLSNCDPYFIGTAQEAKQASQRYHILLLPCKFPKTDESFCAISKYKWRGTHFFSSLT